MSNPEMSTPERPPVHEEKLTVSRAALRLELLEMEVRLKDYMSGRMLKVESDIRDLQEANRLREAQEEVLAIETERRRRVLADDGSRWGIRGNKINLLIGLLVIGSFVLAAANAVHSIFH